MDKLSSEQLLQVVAAVPGQLRKLASERDALQVRNEELEAKVSEYELRERATKLAQKMHAKGVRADEDLSDLVESLQKQASELPLWERALELTGPDMSAFGSPGGKAETGNAFLDAILGNV